MLFLLLWAQRNYLYESKLAYSTVELELVGFFMSVFVLIRMVNFQLKAPFEQFYTM